VLADDPLETAVSESLGLLAEMLANPKPITPLLIEGWTAVLRHAEVRAEEVRPVVVTLLKTATYFPTPAQFLEALRPTEDVSAAEELAWQRALGVVRKVGGYASIDVRDVDGDPCVLWALSRMGWERICRELDEEKRAIWRAEFVRVYRLGSRNGAAVHYLAGRLEADNLSKGRALTPALVGRPDWPELPAGRTAGALPSKADELYPLGVLMAGGD